MIDDEIVRFVVETGGGQAESVLPVLDHVARTHPELLPAQVIANVDAAIARLYIAGRATFRGLRWVSKPPETVGTWLTSRAGELVWDADARRFRWRDTAWTDHIAVR